MNRPREQADANTAQMPTELEARLAKAAADRARLRRQLSRSEARFRDVIERNADAIVVVDHQGMIRFANLRATELFGSAVDQLINTHFGFPVVAGETTELDLVRDCATRVLEMRVVESEWQGKPAFIASLRDITDRKLEEERARQLIEEQAARQAAESMADRFRFLAECSATLASSLDYTKTLSALARHCVRKIADWVVIYIVADDGKIERLEVALRDSAHAAVAEHFKQQPVLITPGHPLENVLRTGDPILKNNVDPEELTRFVTDPRQRELIVSLDVSSYMIVPMIARGRAVGAIALACLNRDRQFSPDDLTLARDLAMRAALAVDNAQLYTQAQEANRTKSDFLALVSHDLRTPLNSILGYAELMSMGIPDPITEGNRQRLERVRTSASHLLYLLDELLTFARLDTQHETLELGTVELNRVVREVGMMMEPLAVERGIRLTVQLEPDGAELRTDANKLRQVLVNLVSNAVKYTERGQVTVRARADDAFVTIDVADTGPGIAPEHLERIFDPFWQLDPSRRAHGGGTGLGLSIVKRLVSLMGGQVSVTSELGQGTVFTVRLAVTPVLPREIAT